MHIQERKGQSQEKRKIKIFGIIYSFQEQFQQFLQIMSETQRRNLIHTQHMEVVKEGSDASLSTEGSSSPRYFEARGQKANKEKLELCKKFTQYGYCPYQKKCKFAHGYHELRKNNSTNSKYKTKECVTFFKNCYCHYGSRCNFMHIIMEEEQPIINRSSMRGYAQVFQCAKSQSKVLALLKC